MVWSKLTSSTVLVEMVGQGFRSIPLVEPAFFYRAGSFPIRRRYRPESGYSIVLTYSGLAPSTFPNYTVKVQGTIIDPQAVHCSCIQVEYGCAATGSNPEIGTDDVNNIGIVMTCSPLVTLSLAVPGQVVRIRGV